MKEWFIASALAVAGGTAVVGGAFDRPDIVSTVDRPPSVVYDGFAVILNDYSPDLYQIAMLSADPTDEVELNDLKFEVKSEEDEFIDYRLKVQGKPVLHVKVAFEPLEGGKKTKVEADVDFEAANLPPLDGEAAPIMPGGEIALNAAMQITMNQIISRIEDGTIAAWSDKMTMLRGEIMSHPDFAKVQMNAVRARREYSMDRAVSPMVDPSEAAVNPVGVSAAPSVDVSR